MDESSGVAPTRRYGIPTEHLQAVRREPRRPLRVLVVNSYFGVEGLRVGVAIGDEVGISQVSYRTGRAEFAHRTVLVLVLDEVGVTGHLLTLPISNRNGVPRAAT